jgi:hypothetical protein
MSGGPDVVLAAYLDEANGSALFTEALSAQIEAVLPDETGLVGTEAAGGSEDSWLTRWQRPTTGGCLFRIYGDERTRRRRVSSMRV